MVPIDSWQVTAVRFGAICRIETVIKWKEEENEKESTFGTSCPRHDPCARGMRRRKLRQRCVDHDLQLQDGDPEPDGRDGGEVLQAIRHQENGLCKETPVVLLSANVEGNKTEEYSKMGFDGFLEKPINAAKLE